MIDSDQIFLTLQSYGVVVNSVLMRSLIFIIFILLVGCTADAPRDNPFDPNAEIYKHAVALEGTVIRKAPPYQGIPGAEVRLLNGPGEYQLTDSQGRFRFERLPADTAQLQVNKAGYGEVVRGVPLPARDVEIALNGRPQIDSLRIYTTHRSYWWPVEEEYMLTIEAWSSDADGIGDLDSIWFVVPADSMIVGSSAPFTAGEPVSVELYDWQLSGPVTDLVGRMFTCYARDVDSLISSPAEVSISRFIEGTPVPMAPVGDEQTGPRPTLRWDYFNASYTFYYTIDVYRITAGNTAVHMFGKQEIPRSRTEITLSDSLLPGSYYWTLGVEDRFENSSYSKEATFTVPQ